MLHRRVEEFLHGVLRQFMTAEGISDVDLVVAVAGDVDAGIPRDREQRRALFLRVHGSQHQRVGTAHVVYALVHAHDHDGGLVLRHQERFRGLVGTRVGAGPPVGLVEKARRGEVKAQADARADEDGEKHPKQIGTVVLLPCVDDIVAVFRVEVDVVFQ